MFTSLSPAVRLVIIAILLMGLATAVGLAGSRLLEVPALPPAFQGVLRPTGPAQSAAQWGFVTIPLADGGAAVLSWNGRAFFHWSSGSAEFTEIGDLGVPRASGYLLRPPAARVSGEGDSIFLTGGGSDTGRMPDSTWELFDAAAGSVSSGDAPWATWGVAIAALPGGEVLVVGGQDGLRSKLDAFVWSATSRDVHRVASMAFGRREATTVSLKDGRVLVVGGAGAGVQSAEIFDPVSETWTLASGASPEGSSHVAVRLSDGRVLVVGCAEPGVARTAIFDDATSGFSTGPALDRCPNTGVQLPDGQVLLGGSWDTEGNLTDGPWLGVLDLATQAFSETVEPMRTGFKATVLDDGTVILVGGYTSREVTDDPSLTWAAVVE